MSKPKKAIRYNHVWSRSNQGYTCTKCGLELLGRTYPSGAGSCTLQLQIINDAREKERRAARWARQSGFLKSAMDKWNDAALVYDQVTADTQSVAAHE